MNTIELQPPSYDSLTDKSGGQDDMRFQAAAGSSRWATDNAGIPPRVPTPEPATSGTYPPRQIRETRAWSAPFKGPAMPNLLNRGNLVAMGAVAAATAITGAFLGAAAEHLENPAKSTFPQPEDCVYSFTNQYCWGNAEYNRRRAEAAGGAVGGLVAGPLLEAGLVTGAVLVGKGLAAAGNAASYAKFRMTGAAPRAVTGDDMV